MSKNNKALQYSNVILLLVAANFANAEALLRLQCKGDAAGASVYINNKAYGSCPTDVFLAPGETQLRVVKTVDAEYERVFTQTLNLVDNTAKKLSVKLSAPVLNAKAAKQQAVKTLKQAQAGDGAAMKKMATLYEQGLGVEKSSEKSAHWLKEAAWLKDSALANAVLKKAQSGDLAAMQEMAGLYGQGKGVKQSSKNQEYWQEKHQQTILENEKQYSAKVLASAEAGDIAAMEEIAALYASGTGVEKSSDKAKEWNEKAKAVKSQQAQAKADERNKAQLEARLADYKSGKTYFYLTKEGMTFMDWQEAPSDQFSSVSTMSPVFTFATVLGLAGDLISSPFNASSHIKLQSELNTRAAVWNKPNSMVAKAYAQQQAQQ